MGIPGGFELVIIFLVILLVFGAKRIPEIARGVGKGIREFKDATSEIKREIDVEEKRESIRPPRQGQPQPRESARPQEEQAQEQDPQASDATEQR